ncbi:uncharacterized protein K452DRAFT_307940 [Aplosporella prunicola CBS 121167]|uniref:Uncharacterized protein n=1 Tax=Aplosporella prunicola CBS 121167 TaxID=1176127 RepID=A0A6A6BII7_9PEZI|nr:uncharacterized protein K452DRAFT_307940 [Aplosporella prunicola CBS 121167]KAF2143064.1 hypothetical protein K452DRAFT_307940 [Aplosporella prunicola CBS 121167]
MNYPDDPRAAQYSHSRPLMPARSNSSYLTDAPFAFADSTTMRQDNVFYHDDHQSHLGPHRPSNAAAFIKPEPHAAQRRSFSNGSFADSSEREGDQYSVARATPSPINPNVGSTPPIPATLNSNMQPTWRGFVHTTLDGLMVIEACLRGTLNHCPRRPHDRERAGLIQSGNIFVYEESTSGIKRWTDGVSWSPSRIHGNYLIYRELQRPWPPGEKKRANKPKNKNARVEPYGRAGHHYGEERVQDVIDRKLTGSLVDSYDFKPGGLAKRTLSVTVNGCTHHLIAYHSADSVKDLFRPGHDPRFANCHPRKELLTEQKFRSSIEDPDDIVPYTQYATVDLSMANMSSYGQHYSSAVHGLSAALSSAYHTVSQSQPSMYTSSSSSFSGYPGVTTSPATSHSSFGSIGNQLHMPQARASSGLVSPLSNMHINQSPVHNQHQARLASHSSYRTGHLPSDIQVSNDYQPFSPPTNYTTAPMAAFNQNFGFDRPSQQYHGSISDVNDDSPVPPHQVYDPASNPLQGPESFACYSGTQHIRHDTLGAYDDRAPNYANHFS